MKKVICQICQKREAKKAISTPRDDGSFYVCSKKKCSKEIYDKLKDNPKTSSEIIREIQDTLSWEEKYLMDLKRRAVLGLVFLVCLIAILVFLVILL